MDQIDDRPLSALGEHEAIRMLGRELAEACPPPAGWLGIGDDAALTRVTPGVSLVTTTDLLVEDVHFRLATTSPRDLGWKAMAVNASDLAAMGAIPRWATVSVALPGRMAASWLSECYRGVAEACLAMGVPVLGGDTCGSPGPAFLAVTMVGEAQAPLLRTGAQAGWQLFATGPCGDAAAGLYLLEHPEARVEVDEADAQLVVSAHRTPSPLVAAGRELAALGVPLVLMDDSDGLARSAATLAEVNGLTALVAIDRVPLSGAARRVAGCTSLDPIAWALHGGEDYGLVGATAPTHREAVELALSRAGSPCHWIGDLTSPGPEGVRVEILDREGSRRPLPPHDYGHFQA